jgi:anti-sigma B factor antagonist
MDAPNSPVTHTDGLWRLVLEGRLDALRAFSLRSQFDDLVAEAVAGAAREILIDLSDVTFVDSAALAALVRLRRKCGETRLGLKFVKPQHSDALRIFRLTQFDEVFTMLDREPSP